MVLRTCLQARKVNAGRAKATAVERKAAHRNVRIIRVATAEAVVGEAEEAAAAATFTTATGGATAEIVAVGVANSSSHRLHRSQSSRTARRAAGSSPHATAVSFAAHRAATWRKPVMHGSLRQLLGSTACAMAIR